MASRYSTPATRKKTVSWKTLLSGVNPPDGVDLEQILGSQIDADIFVQNPDSAQESILRTYLGEACDLIPLIIESIQQNMHVPLSVEDELRYFLLAPSKCLDDTSFVQVLGAVCLPGYTSGVPIVNVGAIRKIMFSNPETSSSAISIPESSSPGTSSTATSSLTTLTTNTFAKRMLNLIDKEACGIPLLGVFAAELADHLTLAMTLDIKADMQFPVVKEKTGKPGTKPACDGAICAIL